MTVHRPLVLGNHKPLSRHTKGFDRLIPAEGDSLLIVLLRQCPQRDILLLARRARGRHGCNRAVFAVGHIPQD